MQISLECMMKALRLSESVSFSKHTRDCSNKNDGTDFKPMTGLDSCLEVDFWLMDRDIQRGNGSSFFRFRTCLRIWRMRPEDGISSYVKRPIASRKWSTHCPIPLCHFDHHARWIDSIWANEVNWVYEFEKDDVKELIHRLRVCLWLLEGLNVVASNLWAWVNSNPRQ